MTKIMPNFLSKLSTVLAFTLGAGAVMGILGAWIPLMLMSRVN